MIHRRRNLCLRKPLAMIAPVVFDYGNAFSHDRAGQDAHGPVGLTGRQQRAANGFKVVSVGINYLPAGRFVAPRHRHVVYLPRRAAGLLAVPVHDGRQMGQAVLGRQLDRFLKLSLALLAVAHEHIDVRAFPFAQPESKRCAYPLRQALPQAAVAPLHAGSQIAWMSFKHAFLTAVLTEQRLTVYESECRQHAIDRRGNMTHADDDAVAVRRFHIGRRYVGRGIEHHQHVQAGHRASNMPRTRMVNQLHNLPAQFQRNGAKPVHTRLTQRLVQGQKRFGIHHKTTSQQLQNLSPAVFHTRTGIGVLPRISSTVSFAASVSEKAVALPAATHRRRRCASSSPRRAA